MAAAGFGVLRFDYAGTGDSAGSQQEPHQVEGWLASVRAAIDLVQTCGARRVVAIGMRMGATLAAVEVSRAAPLDALVLWDACVSGRSFLHEQQALQMFRAAGPPYDDGRVETPGFRYSGDTVKDMASLEIAATTGPLAGRVLVLKRPDQRSARQLAERLSMSHVEWGDAIGQNELLNVRVPRARVPETTVARIVSWLSHVVETDRAAMSRPANEPAVVGRDPLGRPVVEQARWIGPNGLFGISTEPAGRGRGPTVMFINVATEHHVGPARLWVDFAREWAAFGVRTVRFDLSGIADSPARIGQAEHLAYPAEAIEDILDVARAVAPHDPTDVVLIGLCSGGYHAVNAGVLLGPRGVCAINPPLSYRPPYLRRPAADGLRRPEPAFEQPLAGLSPRWTAVAIKRRLPPSAWWLLDRLAIVPSPGRRLEALVAGQVDTLVVGGEPDIRPLQRRAKAALRRLAKCGKFRCEVIPGLDHSLVVGESRDELSRLLTDHVRSHFAPRDDVAASEAPSAS